MAETRAFNTMYPGYFQTAYVTTDIDRAQEQLGRAHGIRDWYTNRRFEYAVAPGKTATIALALAYVGDSQIEIIEPMAGECAFYRTALTDTRDFQLRFHHLCQAFDTVEQYEAKFAELKGEGVDLPVQITRDMNNGLSLACYADFRHRCGHFIEYVWFSELGRSWMSSVPRN
ncbi:MAG: hypothetical protein JWQ90_2491 [Hydrocarboniphaga sp.]|uniref:VOC family protein n=1 Tax=Hydrocarboniphaga sp. TaxID=2033016 RepID=UPI002608A6D3|nr:VOC family protein [Hydrocarboniphaga sp.]MDB5970041.1 hypothetical protein [Hydrocarboniphaga sp.]